ncbi:MAG: ATP-grasp domain-containing protein [Thermodesulfobacteriota bacterium]
MADSFLFSNFNYNPSTYYFLYIGDIKAYGLNFLLQDGLARKLGRQVEFIAIVPDVLVQYNYRNLIVINPNIEEFRKENGPCVTCRSNSSGFMAAVSENPAINDLISRILETQGRLFVNMYESEPEMTLDEQFAEVFILGPDKQIAKRLNNKTVQYELLADIAPVIDFRICRGTEELIEVTEKLREQWCDGIFVSCEYSAAGANSAITHQRADIEKRFSDPEASYLVTRYLPHEHDPTVLAIVANEKEVFVAGVADQVIIDGNRFIGSTYPTRQPEDVKNELKEHTRKIGQVLGREGYRGIFGCDYLITEKGDIKFLEVNARKQGTTLEFCYTLEQNLPESAASLPELEYHAVIDGTFPANSREMEVNNKNIHWGTYNYKVMERCCTRGYIPQNPYEREAFQKVADGELVKDFVILEHVGSSYIVLPGTFLARVVSVARNHEDVAEGLGLGKNFIQMTVDGHQ